MHWIRRFAVVAGLLAAGCACAAAEPEVEAQPTHETIRGITLSTHTDGQDWALDPLVPTLGEIKGLGAGWVAIHPYAGIRADGSVRFRRFAPGAAPQHILRPIREAHAQGLKILIKPHLAYWGSPFRWRGEITFSEPEQWRRFWRDYNEWITQLAAATTTADGFAVGTELDLTLGFETEWRTLIGNVRQRTSIPLTYAANWSDYRQVGFWDALDVIGIQAYFPLTDETDSSPQAITEGWERWMDTLSRYSDEHNRRIVFTELGYNRSFDAPVRPWLYHTDGAEAEQVQQTCMRIALEAIAAEPAVLGAFLWKWFPQPRSVGRNFQLATPGMRGVIRKAWE